MRKIITVLTLILTAVFLCGCDLFTADTAKLMSPPALTGEMFDISQCLSKSVKGEFLLKYPTSGRYRSAIVCEDIDKDGSNEAFAFFSTNESDSVIMHIKAIEKTGEKWIASSEQSITASGVERVEFSDLDGDGIAEILVGWEIYGSTELNLGVYSLKDGILNQRMLQQYTGFIPCDLDEDEKDEIFILNINGSEETVGAYLYDVRDNGIDLVSSCETDMGIKTLDKIFAGTLSSGVSAVYVDGVKGIGTVTQVFFLEKGQLVNPLYDKDTGKAEKTLRSAGLETKDINDDGLPEIPIVRDAVSVAGSEVSEKQYLTDWCSFNGETLTSQMTVMINDEDGYYYAIPKKWIGKIAILKNTEKSLREFYRYDGTTSVTGERLMYIKAVKKTDWDSGKYDKTSNNEIMNDGETTYICYISDAGKADGITPDKVREDFYISEQGL